MAKDDKDLTPEVITPDDKALVGLEDDNSWLADNWDDARPLADIKEELGIEHPHLKASEIEGQPFILIGVKEFPSSYSNQKHNPLFCTCVWPGTDETFTTVIGGEQPVNLINALMATGQVTPPICTLVFHEGSGKHDGYYTLE